MKYKGKSVVNAYLAHPVIFMLFFYSLSLQAQFKTKLMRKFWVKAPSHPPGYYSRERVLPDRR